MIAIGLSYRVRGLAVMLIIAIWITNPARAQTGAPPEAPGWIPAPCGSPGISLPDGFSGTCHKLDPPQMYVAVENGVSCLYEWFSVAQLGAPGPRFNVTDRVSRANPVCFFGVTTDPQLVLLWSGVKLAFAGRANNWMPPETLADQTVIWLFDSDGREQKRNCFMFAKPGRPHRGSNAGPGKYDTTFYGFFCSAPGEPMALPKAVALVARVSSDF